MTKSNNLLLKFIVKNRYKIYSRKRGKEGLLEIEKNQLRKRFEREFGTFSDEAIRD